MKEFYFVRHGQTDHNKYPDRADDTDISLNETGRAQAHQIKELVATLPIRSICFSPLQRAKETKEIITAQLNADHHELPLLQECTLEVWKEMVAHNLAHEPVKSFMQRALDALHLALEKPGPVLIVAHGGIYWALCCMLEIRESSWSIGNCIPVHFSLDHQGLWNVRKLF